ncbi:craniofacial development protein 1 [Elysia marginata]|uniref:Craniofacial development protein 1 n=1 Tax=Elysia marginata TaxID=1093978 RepID=A0AAV4JN72_9GAST|nr:craniofacial development protein 1 [Elysia marginata]
MSDEEDYNSEEDQDYVPSEGEQVSEEENSGDEEDLSLLHDDSQEPGDPSRKKGIKVKKGNVIPSRKRKGGIKLDAKDQEQTPDEIKKRDIEESAEEEKRRKELAQQAALEEKEKQKEKEKKHADDLWSSFLADVKPVARKPSNTASSSLGSITTQIKTSSEQTTKCDTQSDKTGKVKITKVFDFAGEEIKVTKEVDANSKEAKAEQKKQEQSAQETCKNVPTPSTTQTLEMGASRLDLKRPAVGGLSSVLSKIGKKNKMGTLEKSKIDWDSFKKKEGIDEDLKIHNKGKEGYTERMAFLNRTDQRQFELERDLRLGNSSKR